MRLAFPVVGFLILSVSLAQVAFSGPFQKKPKPQNNMPKTMEEYKIEATRQIKELNLNSKILIFTSRENDDNNSAKIQQSSGAG